VTDEDEEEQTLTGAISRLSSRMGIVGTHPAVFVRVASKGVTGYGK
jgi:hypothetical protein